MNRPDKRNDYINDSYAYDCEYPKELEKYCDALEKALDKSCKFIEEHFCNCPLDTYDYDCNCDACSDEYAKCWKEWCLKDEDSKQ